MMFLGISFLSLLLSLVVTIQRLCTIEFGMSTDFLWYPITGSFVGFIFGTLASANVVESKHKHMARISVIVNLILLAVDFFLPYVLAQLAA